MRAPIRLIRGRCPVWLERRISRFVWQDPRSVLDEAVSAETFRAAMAAFHIGPTFKITGADRHPAADTLLLNNVDLDGATILDIGASDGSTSVDLIAKVSGFKAYIIADLGLLLDVVTVGRWTLFFDSDRNCILVVGSRFISWPTMSTAVRLLYQPLIRLAGGRPTRPQAVLMLNPATRALMASDPRVSAAVHDVFAPWTGPTPDIIKVANLLRRLYFDDDTLLRGLCAVLDNLPDRGHFLLVDNPRTKGVSARAGIYRREQDRFSTVAQTPDPPEIADLVRRARLVVRHDSSRRLPRAAGQASAASEQADPAVVSWATVDRDAARGE